MLTELLFHNTDKTELFNKLWSLELPWFEEPNYRRGGWSGVSKTAFKTDDNHILNVFIKRQENHMSQTWRHPFKGIPTFQKEFDNINAMSHHQIPTLELVFFGKVKNKAILVTKELEGFTSIDDMNPCLLTKRSRLQLLKSIAEVISKMHLHRLKHNALYPKHIFVKEEIHGWQVRVIDLEKMKKAFTVRQALLRDITTLNYHLDNKWTIRDRLVFFHAYLKALNLMSHSKKLKDKISERIKSKHR